MKPTNEFLDARRFSGAAQIVWALRLESAGGRVFLAATRAATLDGLDYPARIVAPPAWSMGPASGSFGVGGRIATRAEVAFADTGAEAGSLRAWLGRGSPIGLSARLELIFLDEDGSVREEGRVLALRGAAVKCEFAPARVRIELVDELSAAADRRVGRDLMSDMIGWAASPSVGEPIPIVFGRAREHPLAPLRAGVATKTTAPFAPGDAILSLASVEGFPDSGVVQIGEALWSFYTRDAAARTLGSAAQPMRPAPGEPPRLHSTGEPVRLVPDGGFQWIVADHPCLAIHEVLADGIPAAHGDWTAGMRALGSESAQVVTMPRWPTLTRHQVSATEKDVDALGGVYAVAAGNTALNPGFAIDGSGTTTSAGLAAGHLSLAIRLDGAAGTNGAAAGLWAGAAVRVRFSCWPAWGTGSSLVLKVVHAGGTTEFELPRPEASGAGDFIADPSRALTKDGGWTALNAGIEMRVEFRPAPGEAAAPRVHDLSLRVRYYARLAGEAARRLSADVEGWANEAGELIRNPADILALLLTHARFGGLDPALLDATGLAGIAAELTSSRFVFARTLSRAGSLGDWLESAAREAGVWVRAGGALITFARRTVTPSAALAVETLDKSRALDPAAIARIETGASGLVKDSLRLVAPEAAAGVARVTWTRKSGDPAARDHNPQTVELNWLAPASDAPLANLGERMWADLREPHVLHEQAYPLSAFPLEPGDTATLDRAELGLDAAPHWIERARLDGWGRLRILARGAEAGASAWAGASGDSARAMGFGSRLRFALDGLAVMELERGGWARLIHSVTEDAAFEAPEATAPLERVGDWLYWSTGVPGAYVPFARLAASGAFELKGTLREFTAPEGGMDGALMTADENTFRLSTDGEAADLEFRASESALLLRGGVVEGVEL